MESKSQAALNEEVGMWQSTTYQAILEEGRAEGRIEAMHWILFCQGEQRFGHPTDAEAQILTGITDEARLFRLAEAMLTASTWQELLAAPCP